MNDTTPKVEKFLNKRRSPYTMVANALLRDSRLSLKAKGLLAVMLSVPDGTTYRMSQVEAVSDDGRDAHRSALRELEAAGYVQRQQTRKADGKLGEAEYFVSDDLRTVGGKTDDGKAVHGENIVKDNKNSVLEISPSLSALPGWEEAWGEWLAYRKERRLSRSNLTLKKQLRMLADQPDPVACIEQSITNGWNGLFEVHELSGRRTKDANSRAVKTAQNAYRAITEDASNVPF